MINTSDLIQESRVILNKPLPTKEAHQRMFSRSRISPEQARSENRNPTESAVLIVLFPHQDRWNSLLIERPGYEGVHSRQIAFPGGKREPADTDLRQTALREAQEEVGIIPDTVQIVGNLSEVYIPPSNFVVTPFVGISEQRPEFIPDSREVESLIEFDVNRLFESHIIKSTELYIPTYQSKLEVNYFDIENHVVWGATGMMLSEFSLAFKELLGR
ncbi:MAG: CoA pyrophosphatase [Flavobacteriales bacterium]|nr:CoA pyrophosphatase [Flavobacteriales bacterium]